MAVEEFNNEQLITEGIQKEEFSSRGDKTIIEEFGNTKKSKIIGKVVGIGLTVFGAGLIIFSVGGMKLGYQPSAVVDVFDLDVQSEAIYYTVNISEAKVDTLAIQIHNQFTKRQQELTIGNNIGVFNNLKPGMQYKISIIESKVLVDSKVVTTSYE